MIGGISPKYMTSWTPEDATSEMSCGLPQTMDVNAHTPALTATPVSMLSPPCVSKAEGRQWSRCTSSRLAERASAALKRSISSRSTGSSGCPNRTPASIVENSDVPVTHGLLEH
jgi:hypothetical protein